MPNFAKLQQINQNPENRVNTFCKFAFSVSRNVTWTRLVFKCSITLCIFWDFREITGSITWYFAVCSQLSCVRFHFYVVTLHKVSQFCKFPITQSTSSPLMSRFSGFTLIFRLFSSNNISSLPSLRISSTTVPESPFIWVARRSFKKTLSPFRKGRARRRFELISYDCGNSVLLYELLARWWRAANVEQSETSTLRAARNSERSWIPILSQWHSHTRSRNSSTSRRSSNAMSCCFK